jgi:putative transposase
MHHTHLVFTTKYRRRVSSGLVLASLSEVEHSAASELGVVIEEINGEADHVHLLVRHPPDLSFSGLSSASKAGDLVRSSTSVPRGSEPAIGS